MTVPAVAGPGSTRHTVGTLPFSVNPPTTGALIDAALQADISPAAFRFYVAALRKLSGSEPWTLIEMADAAEVAHHGARRLVAPLVAAGLLTEGKGIRDFRKRAVYRPSLPSVPEEVAL
ncbi:MAG TPA: hypothetical protein VFP72_00595 [Kineosporiaceae bacterium]|nr:hypothetical protein [Kineosporiaceae bacterium]